jgi:hypothetical protein
MIRALQIQKGGASMKTLKKAFQISMILIVLLAFVAAPLMVVGVQGSITIGEKQIDFTFGIAHPVADSFYLNGCCGSGTGGF